MILEPNLKDSAEFYKQLQSDLERQMEAEEYFMESMAGLCGIPHDLFVNDGLLSEPLLEDELTSQEYDEIVEIPITEEELFHIIKEQEIQANEKTQY